MLILEHRRELAAKHIEQLKERRTDIAAKIQAVHDALTELSGKAPLSNVTSDLCRLRGRKAFTLAAIKYWLGKTGKGSEHLTDEAILTGIVLPPEVKTLIQALASINGKSEDPERYYKSGEFAPLAVTPAEEEIIYERSVIKAKSKDDIDMYNFVRLRCMLANKYNQDHRYGRISEGDLLGTSGNYQRAFMFFDTSSKTFRVNKKMFGTEADFTPAFDEGTVSMD